MYSIDVSGIVSGIRGTLFAQQDTLYKRGYLFFKYERKVLPLQVIFVEKDNNKNNFKDLFSDRFNVLKDTGTFIILNFLENPNTVHKLLKHALNLRLWSQISVKRDDTINTYKHEMRVLPVLLQVIFPQVSFTEFYNENFPFTIFSENGPVLETCRHQSVTFGIVKNIYRYYYY